MYKEDIHLLCCPVSKAPLEFSQIEQEDEDGEVLQATLFCTESNISYSVVNGIPRFITDKNYNKTWNYKWTEIDKGEGINYSIVDKSDPDSHEMFDIFDKNSYGNKAHQHATNKVALDIGCGVGQYSYQMMDNFSPSKLVSMDLTEGVDIFRSIMLKKFPEYKKKFLFVQASVFEMPFRDETFDYVFSLGVLHHTGNTLKAIENAARVTKDQGHLNIWVYFAESVPYEAREPGRQGIKSPYRFAERQIKFLSHFCWTSLFRKVPHGFTVACLKTFSSQPWYALCKIPLLGLAFRMAFNTCMHECPKVRYINNYDKYCNTWSEHWGEHEIFPTLRKSNIVIQGISEWRTGFWGVKDKEFYE